MSDATAEDALVREFIAAWERRDNDHSIEGSPPGRLEIRNQVAGDSVVMNTAAASRLGVSTSTWLRFERPTHD